MLCDKLSWLLGDPHLRETMGRRAVDHAQGYRWERIACQIVDVYRELLEEEKVISK
jgi:hypothetical protein